MPLLKQSCATTLFSSSFRASWDTLLPEPTPAFSLHGSLPSHEPSLPLPFHRVITRPLGLPGWPSWSPAPLHKEGSPFASARWWPCMRCSSSLKTVATAVRTVLAPRQATAAEVLDPSARKTRTVFVGWAIICSCTITLMLSETRSHSSWNKCQYHLPTYQFKDDLWLLSLGWLLTKLNQTYISHVLTEITVLIGLTTSL